MGKSISLKPVTTSRAEKQALKRRNLIEKVDAKFKGIGEPQVTFLNYKLDLIHALNWYNVYHSNIDKKKWTLATITDKKQLAKLSKLDDSMFRMIGTLLRITNNGHYLDTKELNYIDTRLTSLLEYEPNTKSDESETIVPKKKVPVVDKTKEEAYSFAAEIDGELDTFIRTGYPRNFEFKSNAKSISGPAAKLIPKIYKLQIDELTEVLEGSCEQLKEAYSHVKTVQIKKWLSLLTDLVASCTQQVVRVKKVKTVKPKAPSDLIKHLKYLVKFDELELRSENPIKLVDSQEIWLYNTKYKALMVYRAEKDSKLSINRTTITGFDVKTSSARSVRKPEIIKGMNKLTKKELANKFKELKTKENVPNGRINEFTIILKIFS